MWLATGAVVATFLALGLAACGGESDTDTTAAQTAAQTTQTETAAELVEVPSVIGMQLADARKTLRSLGLTTSVEKRYSSEAESQVIAQDPRDGIDVAKDTRVDLTASKGPKPSPPSGPSGHLGTSSIGSVEVGMSESEVEELFGEPDKKYDVNFGGGPAPQENWDYYMSGGVLILQFETKHMTVSGYICKTPTLQTVDGFRVGDPIRRAKRRYGRQLARHPIGAGGWMLSENERGSFPALTFVAQRGKIVEIEGGLPQPAGD